MRARHAMPFGTEITSDGVRFRLWAPDLPAVTLCIGAADDEARHAMAAAGDGWFEAQVPGTGAGTRYRFDVADGLLVPDPASRFNPDDVHAASEVVDPAAFDWQDADWRGRPWEDAVVYELHVGSFSPEGTFAGVEARLDYLVELGVTAIELMPVADFPGERGWGYDGVLPFAPESRYGRPEDLKSLVQAAHARGLMVLLDVVYNHFGPEGNYLHVYAQPFFSQRHHTLWGAAINFDGAGSRTVREFFIHNALYWLTEYRFDGLRLDAVHAIADDSTPHILDELAQRVHEAFHDVRPVHLVLENDANQARYLGPGRYAAQWNDDIHHALHVLATGETDGYYGDYADSPITHLGRCLAEGFAYQGDPSTYRNGEARGEPSAHLPPLAFVSFLQNHDQVGNRAFGERITQLSSPEALRAVVAVMLLAPAVPLVFMGEEFGAETPFPFFCDFGDDLRAAVTDGRRREFARFAQFADPAAQATIPDPAELDTCAAAKIDWATLDAPRHAEWLAYYRELLALRRDVLVSRLAGIDGNSARFDVLSPTALAVRWRLGDGAIWHLVANLGETPFTASAPAGTPVFTLGATTENGTLALAPWSVVWTLGAGA